MAPSRRRVVWAGQHVVERLDPALRRPVDEAGGAVLDVLVHGERPGHHGRAAEVHGHQEGEDAGAALGPCAPGRPPHGHRAATARTRRTRPVAPRRCRAGPTVQRLRDEQEGQARTPTGCLEQRAVIAEGVTAGHDPIAQRGDRIVRGPARARRGRSRRAGRASCCRRPARTGAAAGPRPGQDEVPVDGPIGEPYDEALEPGPWSAGRLPHLAHRTASGRPRLRQQPEHDAAQRVGLEGSPGAVQHQRRAARRRGQDAAQPPQLPPHGGGLTRTAQRPHPAGELLVVQVEARCDERPVVGPHADVRAERCATRPASSPAPHDRWMTGTAAAARHRDVPSARAAEAPALPAARR